jgi:GT2 family glycosyltransferase
MDASIIITARNEDPQILDATLAGIEATTRHLRTEVIVVDDGSERLVDCRGSRVHLVRNEVPVGTCKARRIAAELATGPFLVWLDAHMSFGTGWLEQLLVHARSRSLLCSPFWSYDLKNCMCWGADIRWNSLRDYFAGKQPGFSLAHRVTEPTLAITPVPMVIGACYAMERGAYEELGGFSPWYRVWGLEELDLCTRAWMAGLGVACVSFAKVGHLSRAAFPYTVQYDHLEFNQMVLLRTIFEANTIARLEPHFFPLPLQPSAWLAETDLTPWRSLVQAKRRITDEEFFRRFSPELLDAEQTLLGAHPDTDSIFTSGVYGVTHPMAAFPQEKPHFATLASTE